MVILVDEEDRENEGDLVIAAEHVTPEAINFMAKHARGLVCLTLTEERCRQLDLPPMVHDNRSPMGTNFTVSIEAADGVTTGISAHDRARTVRAAVARDAKPDGHRAARPHLPGRGAARRRAGAGGAYRGGMRSGATRRTYAGRGDLRGDERRRYDGPPAAADRVRHGAQAEDRHHRRPDPVPRGERVAGATLRRAGDRYRVWALSHGGLSRRTDRRHSPRTAARRDPRRFGGAGARARAAVDRRSARFGPGHALVEHS